MGSSVRTSNRSSRPFRSLLAGVGLLAAGSVVAVGSGGADAATPAEGTVSASSTTIAWTGGPFVVPNLTGTGLDQPDCTAPTSCDDFTLHVDVPVSFAADHSLEVSVGWPNTAADFDIYLLDDQGNAVATSASSADPELMIADPTPGDYTVRVVPYAPVGESYEATARLTTPPADPAPSTERAPGFRDYAAPRDLSDDVNNAGEPSIGNSFRTGATMYQAYLSTFKVLFDKAGKATWSDVSATAANGCAAGSTQSLDPILFTDRTTGRTFESQLTGVNSLTCYTDDDGGTWAPSTGGGIPSGVDHQTIGGGPFTAGGTGSLPTTDYPNTVYYCSQDIATAFCAASLDGGTTFGPGVPTYDLTQCGGLHGHVKVAPDGTAYLPNKSCGSTAAVAVSTDDGLSWQVKSVPGTTPGDSDPSVGVGANGTTYFGYVGADGRPGVATSGNRGDTWRDLQPVGSDLGVKNAVFPTMVAGDDDRASFAYLGTTTGGNYQDIDTFTGVWHLYVSTTYDGGRTWVTRNATGADPVQRGSICTGGTTCGDDRNLLDFIDMTLDDHGRVLVGFADGCIDACSTSTDPADNGRDAYATIARQSTGKTLFSKYDDAGPATARRTNVRVRSLRVKARDGGRFVARSSIVNTGRRTVRTRVEFTDNGKRVSISRPFSIAPRTRHLVRARWTRSHGSRHRVVSTVDPAERIRERIETDNSRTRTVRRRR